MNYVWFRNHGKNALAAQMGGAVGVRVNTYSDLVAVRKAVDIPILGLIKTVHLVLAIYYNNNGRCG